MSMTILALAATGTAVPCVMLWIADSRQRRSRA
jgi:hypothetical protein